MKKKIAILVNGLSDNGAARVAANLSVYLPDEEYLKTLIVSDVTENDYPYEGELIDLNIKGSENPIVKLFNSLKRIKKVKKIKSEKKFDTTISFLPNPNLINILSKKNDKIIISVRNYMSENLKEKKPYISYIYSNVYKYIYNRADLIVVVSKAIKQDLIQNFNVQEKKIKVIYNFYDIDKIRLLGNEEIDTEFKDIFNHPTIITAGRLSFQKGQWHLLRAFKSIKNELSEVKLIILGQGTLENELKKLALELGIEEDVHFLGFQNNPFKYVSKSDVYVFPSLYEGFPNALSEAMACGLPVISTDCQSGPREILEPSLKTSDSATSKMILGKYGILVPPMDGRNYSSKDSLTTEEKILAQSVIQILKDRDLLEYYKDQSNKRIIDFQKEQIISEWESIIKY